MDDWVKVIVDCMYRYVGQTVTVFTTSGGVSGSGFTGVLLSADCNVIRLLADVGAAPACPVGSCCTGGMLDGNYGGYGYGGGGYGYGGGGCGYGGGGCGGSSYSCGGSCGCSGGVTCCDNVLGAICVIPSCSVACFTHNAI